MAESLVNQDVNHSLSSQDPDTHTKCVSGSEQEGINDLIDDCLETDVRGDCNELESSTCGKIVLGSEQVHHDGINDLMVDCLETEVRGDCNELESSSCGRSVLGSEQVCESGLDTDFGKICETVRGSEQVHDERINDLIDDCLETEVRGDCNELESSSFGKSVLGSEQVPKEGESGLDTDFGKSCETVRGSEQVHDARINDLIEDCLESEVRGDSYELRSSSCGKSVLGSEQVRQEGEKVQVSEQVCEEGISDPIDDCLESDVRGKIMVGSIELESSSCGKIVLGFEQVGEECEKAHDEGIKDLIKDCLESEVRGDTMVGSDVLVDRYSGESCKNVSQMGANELESSTCGKSEFGSEQVCEESEFGLGSDFRKSCGTVPEVGANEFESSSSRKSVSGPEQVREESVSALDTDLQTRCGKVCQVGIINDKDVESCLGFQQVQEEGMENLISGTVDDVDTLNQACSEVKDGVEPVHSRNMEDVREANLVQDVEKGGEKLESHVPAGNDLEKESSPHSSAEGTENIDEKKCPAFSREDENMEHMAEVAGEDGQFLEAGANRLCDHGADLEDATAMDVEKNRDYLCGTEGLYYKDEGSASVDYCANHVGGGQRLDSNHVNKNSYAEETQVVVIHEEFPVPEGYGNADLEDVKESFTIQNEAEVNGESFVHKDEEKLKVFTNEHAQYSAGKFGLDGHPESSVIDTQEILQVPVSNASEIVAVNKPQILETRKVRNDQTAETHVSDTMSSGEVVMTDGIIKNHDAVENNPQGMVLKKCSESLVVDLDICVDKDKVFVKEDDQFEEEVPHLMTDAEFSEYFDGTSSPNGDLCLDKYATEEQRREMTKQISVVEEANDVEMKISEETLKFKAQVDLAKHLLPEESGDDFSVSALVWGKVKSHPWWPGQIYDPEDASEKALKYHKKDNFLVAYFGDRTFAWNEASVLKPFWTNFSQIEKQSCSEVLGNAITAALEEVSRRIMLGLACSCIPNDIYRNFECQIVENTGIRQESSRRYGLDESTGVSLLKPSKLIEYIRALAESPSSGTDRLGLVIAKAQLLAFSRMRGYYSLPNFQFFEGLLESEEAANSVFGQANECPSNDNSKMSKLILENRSSNKRKHNLKDGSYSSKREKRLSDLMGDGGSAEPEKRISFYAAKVSSAVTPVSKPSFKIGDCIRRAASQLTGSTITRNGNEKPQKADGIIHMQSLNDAQSPPMENSSSDGMLRQLQILARDPMRSHSYGDDITNFFFGFRDSINLSQYAGRQSSVTGKSISSRKRKVSHAIVGSPEEFEFDDVSDSYWTDMTIQNPSEEQPGDSLNGGCYQLVTLDQEKSHKTSRKKRFSSGNHQDMAIDEPLSDIDQMRQLNLPTELILNFPDAESVPSEMHLVKTFRRFGPLKEAETEVDLATSRARVVFKRCSDAEVACSSAGKFNIFGEVLVNYQLNYWPSISFSTFPHATSEALEYVA